MDGHIYFDELYGGVTISKSKFIEEHNNLLRILKSGSKQDRIKEAKDQGKELAAVIRKKNKK